MFSVASVMPEPPRWLIQNNRLEEAEDVFKRMAKMNKTKVPEGLSKMLEEIRVTTHILIGLDIF